MLPVSPEELRPFPEPEWLQEPTGLSWPSLALVFVLCLGLAAVALWAWQSRGREPTARALLALLSLRAQLTRALSDTAAAWTNAGPNVTDQASGDFPLGSDRRQSALHCPPMVAKEISPLDLLAKELRQWLSDYAWVIGEPAASCSGSWYAGNSAQPGSRSPCTSGQRSLAGTAVTERWRQKCSQWQRLLAELDIARFSGRPLPIRQVLDYVDEATAILAEFLCPSRN